MSITTPDGFLIMCDDGKAKNPSQILSAYINGYNFAVVGVLHGEYEIGLYKAESYQEAEAYLNALCFKINIDHDKRKAHLDALHDVYSLLMDNGYDNKLARSFIYDHFKRRFSESLCNRVVDDLLDNHYISTFGGESVGVPKRPLSRTVNRMLNLLSHVFQPKQSPPIDSFYKVMSRANEAWPKYPATWRHRVKSALLDLGHIKERRETIDICDKIEVVSWPKTKPYGEGMDSDFNLVSIMDIINRVQK